jgi:hypothetical protein
LLHADSLTDRHGEVDKNIFARFLAEIAKNWNITARGKMSESDVSSRM